MRSVIQITIVLFGLWVLFPACEEDSLPIPFIQVALEPTPASAYGARDGAVQSTVEGGQPPYRYFWSNGSQEEQIAGLPAGEYTLKVIDSRSAVASATAVVEQPEATPLVFNFSVTEVSWYGGDDGAVELSVMGGTPPYSAIWSNGGESLAIEGLTAGQYSVTVTDSGGPAIITIDSVMVGQPEFVCGRDSITDVDGNKYPTVQIGGQCWTAENLRTLHLPEDPAREIEGRFCLNLNCTNAFGAHYSWEAMMNGAGSVTAEDEVQGICPCEWHLPTKEEWEALNSYLSVDGNGGAGVNVPNKMRGADSPSGFDALYAGNWGYSVFEGENAVFWTATEQAGGRAFYRLINNFPLLGQGHLEKRSGLSVRCVRNRQ
ncbi:MAG: hypothetical protein KDD06_25670 [Phaeodactylibacter sp.]|nr:hypothetical protein [Phaeodactylibacter sp.]MCB9263791.1 hypothetical protein [Lewinellaceae bacterium]MCB9290509.1 hypothetical protein [Lewinellaceae bacterium]